MMAGEHSAGFLGLFRGNASFRMLFAAQVICQGGDWFTMIPLIILLNKLTGSASIGAFLMGMETLVIAVVSPVAGSIIDRVPRKPVLVTCLFVSCFSVLLLPLIHDVTTVWLAIVTYAILASSKSFFTPTVNAIVPEITSAGQLLTANASMNSVWGVMLALGGSLGGLASALGSPYACFLLTSLAYVCSAVLLAVGLPRQDRRTMKKPLSEEVAQPRRGLMPTLQYCCANRQTVALLFAQPASQIGNGAIALFPVLVIGMPGNSVVSASLLYAARGVGAMFGPLLARWVLRQGLAPRVGIFGAICAFGVGYGLLSLAHSVVVAFCCVALAHAGGSMNTSLAGFGLQRFTTDDIRGGVFAMFNMLAMGAIAIGQFSVSGALTVAHPQHIAQAISALVISFGLLWAFCTRMQVWSFDAKMTR